MRHINLLTAFLLSVIILASNNMANAQQDTVLPHNNTVMNRYSYTPEKFQRGSSTSVMKMFPNPARSTTNIYINSIKERDNGEMIVYNTNGTILLRNTIQPGNNDVNVSNLSPGMYIVKVFTKDRSVYTQQLVVSR